MYLLRLPLHRVAVPIYSVGNMSSLRDLFGFYLKKSRSSNFYCFWRLFTPLFLEVDFTEVTNAWHLLT